MSTTLLRVNLSTATLGREPVADTITHQFIGSRGVANKLLFDSVAPRIDPFDPRNPLIFPAGPLTGTFAPTGGRYMVVTRIAGHGAPA